MGLVVFLKFPTLNELGGSPLDELTGLLSDENGLQTKEGHVF